MFLQRLKERRKVKTNFLECEIFFLLPDKRKSNSISHRLCLNMKLIGNECRKSLFFLFFIRLLLCLMRDENCKWNLGKERKGNVEVGKVDFSSSGNSIKDSFES
jgi:hypothetical protein